METLGISSLKGMVLLLLLIVTLVHILLEYKMKDADKRFKEHLEVISSQKYVTT